MVGRPRRCSCPVDTAVDDERVFLARAARRGCRPVQVPAVMPTAPQQQRTTTTPTHPRHAQLKSKTNQKLAPRLPGHRRQGARRPARADTLGDAQLLRECSAVVLCPCCWLFGGGGGHDAAGGQGPSARTRGHEAAPASRRSADRAPAPPCPAPLLLLAGGGRQEEGLKTQHLLLAGLWTACTRSLSYLRLHTSNRWTDTSPSRTRVVFAQLLGGHPLDRHTRSRAAAFMPACDIV